MIQNMSSKSALSYLVENWGQKVTEFYATMPLAENPVWNQIPQNPPILSKIRQNRRYLSFLDLHCKRAALSIDLCRKWIRLSKNHFQKI